MKKFLLFVIIAFFSSTFVAQNVKNVKLTFDNIEVGKVPVGWAVNETNRKGDLSVWEVVKDSTAPSGDKVLSLVDVKNNSGRTYNVCWTKNITFLNGEITVMFKANSGDEDEGGGIMWRVKDKGNYYVARFNPLEDNFRIYYVKNEYRREIASANIKLAKRKWHKMKIVQDGKKISGFLNGEKLIEVEDTTFADAGGVGLWTKADAATSFDNFEVKK